MASPRWPKFANVAVFLAVMAVFFIDMKTPLGLGVPFLYLLVALFAIGNRVGTPVLVGLAALSTGLASAKLILAPAAGEMLFGEVNRAVFTVLIWALLGLELIRRRCEQQVEAVWARSRQELQKLVQERTRALQDEIAERKQAEQTVNDYARRLQGLADQLVDAEEKERTRLAAELHDRIGQNLSALNLSLSLALNQLPAAAEAPRTRIKDAVGLVERTTEMVRGVMEELHPTLLDQYGLEVALRWYGEEYSLRTGIRICSRAPEDFPRLAPKVEMALFRITQEALTNVAKHARAAEVVVSLAQAAAGIEMSIADDGIGMGTRNPEEQPVGSGWGLAIMDERARSVGAALRIDSPPGGGTRILVKVANGLWEKDDGDNRTDR